jgi:integrase
MAGPSLSIEYLQELSREWTDSKTSLAAQVEEPLRPDCADLNLAKIKADTSVVHTALINQVPKTISIIGDPVHLTARDIESVLEAATGNAGRMRKAERTRYLYWLLCRLGALSLITFTLPVEAIDRPPRALAFIADDPNLPLASRFRAWQQHFASLALDTRLRSRQGKTMALQEREFRALAALFAFGGPCGRKAIADVARINRSDLLLGKNTLWLRDEIGNRTIELTLHPVQSLAFTLYIQAIADINYRKANGDGSANRDALFPSVKIERGRRYFRRWLAREFASADQTIAITNAHCQARTRLEALLAGVRRWMLNIYPAYLVSVLAGRFHATAISLETGKQQQEQRQGIPKQQKDLRKRLRRELRRFLGTDTGIFSKRNVDDLCNRWGDLIRKPIEENVGEHPEVVQSWNLFLLTRSLERLLREGYTDRYNTFERLFNTGCAILNALGDRPAWLLGDEEASALTHDMVPTVIREIAPHLYRMSVVAAEYGLCACPEPGGKRQRRGSKRPSPRNVPRPEDIERIARHLLEEEQKSGPRKRVVPPRVVLLYMDLLALGLRKEEALLVKAEDIDFLDDAEETDLLVYGHKTPAALRRVPLDRHPHRESARRVIGVARALLSDRKGKTPMLMAVSGRRYRRYRRVGAEDKTVTVAQLDRALTNDGRRCGVHDLTPHQLRHTSITSWLLMDDAVPELIAKFHGQVDLPTTFEHYVHGLSLIQRRDLKDFLARKENCAWVAAPDAVKILGVSKQALYRRYPANSKLVRESDDQAIPGMVLYRPGRPRYIEAGALADRLLYRTPRIVSCRKQPSPLTDGIWSRVES